MDTVPHMDEHLGGPDGRGGAAGPLEARGGGTWVAYLGSCFYSTNRAMRARAVVVEHDPNALKNSL